MQQGAPDLLSNHCTHVVLEKAMPALQADQMGSKEPTALCIDKPWVPGCPKR